MNNLTVPRVLDPDVLAAEIIEDLKAALAEFEELADELEEAAS